ncbi:MAG: hypothetical protein WC593_06520 [Methanoregula sp.]
MTGRTGDRYTAIYNYHRDDDEYETELQMAAYVLWAKEYYRKSADEISTELVFLKTGATKPYAFYEEQLRDVQEMIPREFAMMNASYEYGDFPARLSQRECLSLSLWRIIRRRD